MRFAQYLSTLLLLCFVTAALADDWPQWMGPKRDSVWRESGIVDQFPKNGLKIKWRTPVSMGYSGPAVAGGRVFVTDYVLKEGKVTNNPGRRDKLEGLERLLCLDINSGELLWEHKTPRTYNFSYPGTRCTPTVDGDKVYLLGAEGDLQCLRAENGELLWERSFTKEFGAKTPIWGFAAHPLVVGDLLICVGGGKDSIAIAFNKHSGKAVWKGLSASEPGYCPPALIESGGKQQVLIWPPNKLNSLNPKTGELYWSVPLKPSYGMSIAAPRKLGNKVYTCGYTQTAVLLELAKGTANPEILWRGKAGRAVYCSNSTPFLEEGVIYGVDGSTGKLTAVDMNNGNRLWEEAKAVNPAQRTRHGTAFLVKHQDRFFIFNELGDLILAKLSPKKYQEISRFHVLEPTTRIFGRMVVWSHPAFAQKCMFARNDKEIVCVELASSGN